MRATQGETVRISMTKKSKKKFKIGKRNSFEKIKCKHEQHAHTRTKTTTQ
jgi:hypothetical protein